jgi:hypothetical protein
MTESRTALANELSNEGLVAQSHLALVALLVRYLERRPGVCVLTDGELDEARRLIVHLAVTFRDEGEGQLALVFERWPRRAEA